MCVCVCVYSFRKYDIWVSKALYIKMHLTYILWIMKLLKNFFILWHHLLGVILGYFATHFWACSFCFREVQSFQIKLCIGVFCITLTIYPKNVFYSMASSAGCHFGLSFGLFLLGNVSISWKLSFLLKFCKDILDNTMMVTWLKKILGVALWGVYSEYVHFFFVSC